MYHKVRITVVSLIVMVVAVLSSTSTLSYFTDTDSTTNSFVVGNASTVLAIYGDSAGENAFDASEYILTDGSVYKDNASLSQIPFYPQATNDGNIPVYQRFRVVIPIALAGEITLALPTMSDNCVVETTTDHICSNADYTVIYNPSVPVADTPTYAEYYIVSNSPLAVNGTTAEWPIAGIKIGNISGVNGYDSLLTCAEGDNSKNNCTLGIRTYSDAIQTAGFVDALKAFASAGETY